MDIQTNFIKGRMNKSVDERILPMGEYRDALNIRLGSTENSTIGAIENSKGNTQLTTVEYNGSPLSATAVCIGAYEDGTRETMYWFVHDQVAGVDMVVSYNTNINALSYHVVSTSVLNFNPEYLITGVNLIDDMLFWTDNLNPPRKINITRKYPAPIAGVDQITEVDISVILTPPIQSPDIQFKIVAGRENYLDTRFICFAYRYKYLDGQYSALSQFSSAAFCPSPFNVNEQSFANDGMTNLFNGVDVSFYTGGDEVVGIDLCFKQINSNVINVIQKFSKEEQGWADNTTQTIEFSNSKIYSTLPQSELLRLFDNVPLKAKAQTEMGNRIFYGNYVEGYDVTETNGDPILIDYTAIPISESAYLEQLEVEIVNGTASYNISGIGAPVLPYVDSAINLDFGAITLQQGDVVTIDLELKYYINQSTSAYGGQQISKFPASVTFVLDASYATAYDLFNSSVFQDAIGTIGNIQPIATACEGITLTDNFACSANTPVDPTIAPDASWAKYGYGITAIPSPFGTFSSPGSNIINIQVPAMAYQRSDDPLEFLYFYFQVDNVSVGYIKRNYNRSLHSNADYEIGVVYMDKYGRNTTVLTSENNTVFFPISVSESRNFAQVRFNSLAPPWASRYKFVMKPSIAGYNTVYVKATDIYNSVDLGYWFKLEGQNQTKFSVGDTLIVKTDSFGPMNNVVEVEVLDIQSQPASFISGAPAGLYAKMSPDNFSITGGSTEYLVFETIPADAVENLFFESADSYAIVNRYHYGNVLNQSAVNPAIINLDFFNCYTFGNGSEGYKIMDSITGNYLTLGNRFNGISEEAYRQTRNEASITYSGVYNKSTNINKLNEFNLALANFADMETVFGSIQKMHARETDILVLQEDKISYVLAGKNLLSDAAGGGAITSVPEVLGKQIARVEEYGISMNPESFVSHGFDRFFTDAKRGAVIKLTGGSAGGEQLEVVSSYGLRSWFRDKFVESFDGQKLGGYDPYMDEYVLSMKDALVEMPEVVIPCGSHIDANTSDTREFTLELGTATGTFSLIWTVGLIADPMVFQVMYNGVVYSSGFVTSSGSLVVPKAAEYPTQAYVTIIVGGPTQYELDMTCVS
jgi:hypothetical protein